MRKLAIFMVLIAGIAAADDERPVIPDIPTILRAVPVGIEQRDWLDRNVIGRRLQVENIVISGIGPGNMLSGNVVLRPAKKARPGERRDYGLTASVKAHFTDGAVPPRFKRGDVAAFIGTVVQFDCGERGAGVNLKDCSVIAHSRPGAKKIMD